MEKWSIFYISFFGPENRGYDSNGVCDGAPKFLSEKIDQNFTFWQKNVQKNRFFSDWTSD